MSLGRTLCYLLPMSLGRTVRLIGEEVSVLRLTPFCYPTEWLRMIVVVKVENRDLVGGVITF